MANREREKVFFYENVGIVRPEESEEPETRALLAPLALIWTARKIGRCYSFQNLNNFNRFRAECNALITKR